MSSSLRRGALAATALVFPLATLAACGAGNTAQTDEVKPDSAATSVGDIKVQNVNLVTPKAGADGPAAVTGKVFNGGNSAQTLQSIKLPGTSATVQLKPAKGSGPLTVPALGSLQLGGKGNASAVITGLPTTKNGNAEKVVFTLSTTGDIGVNALVVPAASYFGSVGPTAAPSAPASPSGTPSGSGTPSDSGSPSGSTSGSPSGSPQGGGTGITG
ncbi:DUF461 domain-containing protein [Streptomyces fuscigenes]|uniref:DUF461 domain-containing protein n=1 Tax=Streptomyces fuscigenes TaxID=1528880 RepID=UPI001F3E3355|nr:DUF461 domain-containing protein [Streptomyces fuscigenes]MCF3960521.1 DUF461 domain-containing protein [Streptomyces fuscigenes]